MLENSSKFSLLLFSAGDRFTSATKMKLVSSPKCLWPTESPKKREKYNSDETGKQGAFKVFILHLLLLE